MTPACVENCQVCDKMVRARAQTLQCNSCDCWVHAKCIKISLAFYRFIQDNPSDYVNIEVKCPACKHGSCPPAFTSAAASSASDDEGLDVTCVPSTPVSTSTPSPSPENSIVNLLLPPKPALKTYAAVVATPSGSGELSTKVKKRTPKPRNRDALPLTQDIADRVRHLEEIITRHTPCEVTPLNTGSAKRPNRDRCLIVIRAPESSKANPTERMLDDQNFLQNMVSVLFDDNEDGINVVSAFRLGKKPDDPRSNPRPLKVVLKDTDEARRVFSRTSRLKGLDYRVVRDLSPEDRIRMRDAVQELKQRRQLGETNLQIVDFQVVVRRPRVVWHPVALLPRPCSPN